MKKTRDGGAISVLPAHQESAQRATTASILIVDDEPLIRETLAEYLAQEGFTVTACGDGEEALQLAAERCFDVALCDVQLPGIDGIELLERLHKISPETFVLLITAYATVENAVEAFQRGAQDYLMKPILLDEVLNKVRRLLAYQSLYQENQWLRRELHRSHPSEEIIGRSQAMQRVFDMIRKVARTRSTVLLVGESGTGKELVARAIHEQGQAPAAKDMPEGAARFLAVNCAAIPHDLLENQLFGHRRGAFTGADRDQAGVFVHAGNGTVFLDEIGELPAATQAKMLRAIDQKEILPIGANEPVRVEARVLAATNKDLHKEVEAGRFREDLFYRLNVVCILIPPLRDRREDIPDLVEFLLSKNARELDNALQRALILGEEPLITPADLPPDLVPAPGVFGLVDDLSEAVKQFERQHIERILRQSPDKKEAARRLNMGLSSLYRRIAELGIQQ
jgi:DNA-binding NtrC family response regulator